MVLSCGASKAFPDLQEHDHADDREPLEYLMQMALDTDAPVIVTKVPIHSRRAPAHWTRERGHTRWRVHIRAPHGCPSRTPLSSARRATSELPEAPALAAPCDVSILSCAQFGTVDALETIKTYTAKHNINDRSRVRAAIEHYEPQIDFDVMLQQ